MFVKTIIFAECTSLETAQLVFLTNTPDHEMQCMCGSAGDIHAGMAFTHWSTNIGEDSALSREKELNFTLSALQGGTSGEVNPRAGPGRACCRNSCSDRQRYPVPQASTDASHCYAFFWPSSALVIWDRVQGLEFRQPPILNNYLKPF